MKATCLLLFTFILMLGPLAWPMMAQPKPIQNKLKEMHPTRLLAKYRKGARPEVAGPLLAQHGLVVHKHIAQRPNFVVLDRVVAKGAARKDHKNHMAKIKALRESGLFEYVEPDYRIQVERLPDDAALADGRLWGLLNTGQNGGMSGADIGVVPAWDITTGSTNVIVAIIDTGIRYTHPDLATQMWRNPGEIPNNGVDDDRDGLIDNVYGINAITDAGDPFDDHDHGTHVAGTIGAAANNGQPHVGVAWQVRLMACKFLDDSGSGYISDAIACIDFAVTNGAHILNNSWGGGGYSQALYDSIAAARDAGVLFVAAAGNDGEDADSSPHYPSSYPLDNILSVAALDRTDDLATFSNYGRTSVHLAAPGVGVYSCAAGSDSAYATFDGTSMAAPHVSGAAALVVARYPGIPLIELKQRLLSTTVSVPALLGRCVSGGRLNVYAAVTAVPDGALEISVSASSPPPLAAGSTVSLHVTVSDLTAVRNAFVTGYVVGGGPLVFSNNGAPPDAISGDHRYSAVLPVPDTGSNFAVQLTISAPGKQDQGISVDFAIRVPPPNDSFVDHVALSGSPLSITGSNVDGSKEAGEPDHGGNTGGKSVWWSWMAPSSGLITITTEGSSFDTLLGVYFGSSVNQLNYITGDDDSGGGVASTVVISATAGTTYLIAVDGFNALSGSIVLSVTAGDILAPSNDAFAQRIGVHGSSASTTGLNVGASKELGEPNHGANSGGSSVWWTWTAQADGNAIIDTFGSTFDTLLGVYVGTEVHNLTLIAGNDDSTNALASQVVFTAVAGTAYQIAVDGFNGQDQPSSGDIQLNIEGPTPPTPINDLFANRVSIAFGEGTIGGSNESATKESGEPNHGGNTGGKSVWWTWTAPSDSSIQLTTDGSAFDTLLGVYMGTSVGGLTLVAADDDSGDGLNSAVRLTVQAGTTYQIAVDGYAGSAGAIQLNLLPLAPLRMLPPQSLGDGTCRLWIVSSDNRPLDPSRASAIEVYACANLMQPMSEWTRLTGGVMASVGRCFIDDVSPMPMRFYRIIERP